MVLKNLVHVVAQGPLMGRAHLNLVWIVALIRASDLGSGSNVGSVRCMIGGSSTMRATLSK